MFKKLWNKSAYVLPPDESNNLVNQLLFILSGLLALLTSIATLINKESSITVKS